MQEHGNTAPLLTRSTHRCLQVTNRRAWADPHWLTPGLLALYRRPLHVQGWDRALVEVRGGLLGPAVGHRWAWPALAPHL